MANLLNLLKEKKYLTVIVDTDTFELSFTFNKQEAENSNAHIRIGIQSFNSLNATTYDTRYDTRYWD